jgi:hypothetical protein
MKNFIIILLILFFLIGMIYELLHLTNLILSINLSPDFFTALSSISTSIASIGGLLLLIVTIFYLLETRKIAIETTKQRKLLEEPAVSLRMVPDNKDPNFLFFSLKNTGGGAAYDISVEFKPDIEYRGSSLNALNMFENMPLLDKGDESKFFFDSAVNYYKGNNPKETQARITYYRTPKVNKHSKPIIREVVINFEERKGQLHLSRRDLHDLVNEIEELKQTLLISSIEKGDENLDRKSLQKTGIPHSVGRRYINNRKRRIKKGDKKIK